MTTMTIDPGTRATEPSHGLGDEAALTYRLEGELRGTTPVSYDAEGIRFVNELDTQVVTGPFLGAALSLDVDGHVVPPQGMELPRPEIVAAPGYDFPDEDFRLMGSALIRTADPRYRHLDGTVASIEGWVNFESGELEIEAHAA